MVNDVREEPWEARYLQLLDPDPGLAADKYLDLFSRLVKFFEWRKCQPADDLAQETLRRGFARIAAGADVYAVQPHHYFFGIARNVARETWKGKRAEQPGELDELPARGPGQARRVDAVIFLEQCLAILGREERNLLVRYHTEDRDALRHELQVDANGLRVRVHRIILKVRRHIEGPSVPTK